MTDKHKAIEKFSALAITLRGTTKDIKWTLSKFSNNLSEEKSNR